MTGVSGVTGERYVVLDLETNGLSPRRGGEVIEVGAVRVTGGRLAERFHALTRSNLPIPAEAVGVHGISDAMLQGCPHFSETFPELLRFLGGDVLCAHNAGFDRSFLDAECRRTGRPPLANDTVDTLRLSRALDPHLDRHDLESLCVHHRVRRGPRHRALPDAEATAELLVGWLARAAERGVRTRRELLDLAGCPASAADAPEDEGVALSPEEQERLADAAVVGDCVTVTYRSRGGSLLDARVIPYAVDGEGGRARLIAYDLGRDATRSLLLGRIVRVSPSD